MKLEVIVMACPDGSRPTAHARTRRSLEASDVGSDYIWLAQSAGQPAADHWLGVMERAANSPADLVLVLEDDAIVGRHIAHNVKTWEDVMSDDCGAGWAYNPGGLVRATGPHLGSPGTLFGTIANVYRPSVLAELIPLALHAQHQAERRLPWDCSIDYAVQRSGRLSWIHYPSLAEHPVDVPSYVGNPNRGAVAALTRSSCGTFDMDWRR